jgi:hypothetical protein
MIRNGNMDYTCNHVLLRQPDVIHDTGGNDLTTNTQRIVSTERIICQAPPGPLTPPDQKSSPTAWEPTIPLRIKVVVDGTKTTSCSGNICRVYYSTSVTPSLKSLVAFDHWQHSTISGGDLMNVTATMDGEISMVTPFFSQLMPSPQSASFCFVQQATVQRVSLSAQSNRGGTLAGETCDLLDPLELGLNKETNPGWHKNTPETMVCR